MNYLTEENSNTNNGCQEKKLFLWEGYNFYVLVIFTILFTILMVMGFLEYRFPQLRLHQSLIIRLYKETEEI